VQLKIEAEFPRFVQHLTEVTCPTLAAPLPAMAIVRLHPDAAEPKLAGGVTVARNTSLRSTHARGADTRCQFRTAHDVTLWPLEMAGVQYFSFAPDLPLTQLPNAARVRGGLRIRLRAFDGIKLNEVALDKLTFYLAGPDDRRCACTNSSSAACSARSCFPPSGPRVGSKPVLRNSARGRLRRCRGAAAAGARRVRGYRLLQDTPRCRSAFFFSR